MIRTSLRATGSACIKSGSRSPTVPNWIWDIIYTDKQVLLTATATAVPVPAAVWLFGSGLLGLVGVARRRGH